MCVVIKQEAYKGCAGTQVRLSLLRNSLSSFSSNNLRVYFTFGTSWNIISAGCLRSVVCTWNGVERRTV